MNDCILKIFSGSVKIEDKLRTCEDILESVFIRELNMNHEKDFLNCQVSTLNKIKIAAQFKGVSFFFHCFISHFCTKQFIYYIMTWSKKFMIIILSGNFQ